MIKAHQLAKHYRANKNSSREMQAALAGIEFEIDTGATTAVFGENGSGKSTLLSLLSGQFTNYRGSLLINGVAAPKHLQAHPLGYAGESAQFPDHLTVTDILKFVANLQGLSGENLNQKLQFVYGHLDLSDFHQRCFGELSKGMKQRVNLAQSLMTESDYIIWDEPTSGLDWRFSETVLKLLQKLQSKNRTIVYSSHDLDLIEKTADTVLHLDSGKIRYNGSFQGWESSLSSEKSKPEASLIRQLHRLKPACETVSS